MATSNGRYNRNRELAEETAVPIQVEIPQFVEGAEYSRREDIHKRYGGSWQSGIAPSSVCPVIFLFTGDSGEQYGYRDGFDSAGVFSYTGQGQLGDMTFTSGNKAIRDHATDGRALHLFKDTATSGIKQYLGEFSLANYSIHRAPDKQGAQRNVIVFHLAKVNTESPEIHLSVAAEKDEPISLDDARKRALAACSSTSGSAGSQAIRTIYERSKAVRDYVLLRSNGLCEACEKPAPFTGRDGKAYLEAHHTQRLSDGGVDHPRYVAALCPACHREIHYGQSGHALNEKVKQRLASKETGDDF